MAASIMGGLLCWKVADTWPLFYGSILVCGAMLLIPICFMCRNREDRLLACAVGGLVFELFFCLREYVLFSYCEIRMGSREGLNLSTVTICLYDLLKQTYLRFISKNKITLLLRD